MSQSIIFTNEINQALAQLLSEMDFNKLFVLTDENTAHYVAPKFGETLYTHNAININTTNITTSIYILYFFWNKSNIEGCRGTPLPQRTKHKRIETFIKKCYNVCRFCTTIASLWRGRWQNEVLTEGEKRKWKNITKPTFP